MKVYTKPELYFESFELAQHIAACDLKLTSTLTMGDSKDGCWAKGNLGGYVLVENLFLSGDADCTTSLDTYEGYCYQSFTAIEGTHMS